jgi:uncharacterized membrane protein
MQEILLGLLALGAVALIILILPIASLISLGNFRREQEAASAKLSRQLRDIEKALDAERTLVKQLVGEMKPSAAGPATAAASPAPTAAPKPVEALEPEVVLKPTPVPPEPPAVPAIPVSVKPVLPPAGVPKHLRRREGLERVAAFAGSLEVSAPTSTSTGPTAPLSSLRQPSRFETTAKEVLHKIWNWIVVGEEHVPEGVSVEFAIASHWLLRVGVLFLVIGVGFFLKYSVEHGLLSPTARVILSTAAGLGLLIGGLRILGGKYHIMGQGLMGGGVAALYFSAFAAVNFYHLITLQVAFGLMIAITALACFMAVRFQTLLVAVLGIIGGYGTPIMLSTGQVNFPGLYGYMLVLGIGVLVICALRQWPLLNYLSLLCNYALVLASLRDFQIGYFWEVMPFLAAFFVLFSTMVFIYNLANRTKSNLLDVIALFLNAGVFFVLSFRVIEATYGQKWVAVATLGLAAFYAAHVYYCLFRRVLDRELMVSFLGLSAFFLTITMPLLLSGEWITVSWAVQALVLLWISIKLDSRFLRQAAYVVYAIVLFRLGVWDLPGQFQSPLSATPTLSEYWPALLQRLVIFGVPIASMAASWKLLQKAPSGGDWAVGEANDVGEMVPQRFALTALVSIALGTLFLYLQLELSRTVGFMAPAFRLPVLTLVWLAACLFLLLQYAATARKTLLVLFTLFGSALLIKLFVFDLPSWSISERFWYEGDYHFGDGALRLLDFGTVIAFAAWAAFVLRGKVATKEVGKILGAIGLGLLFVYSTLELNTFLHTFVEGLRSGGVSILWSVFALSLLLWGILKQQVELRYVGLVLFAVVVAKVFMFDLASLDQLYRIVAFVLLGGLVLSGSFLYLRFRRSFLLEADVQDAPQ